MSSFELFVFRAQVYITVSYLYLQTNNEVVVILPPERSNVMMPRFRPAQGLKAPLGMRTAFLVGAQPENPSKRVKLAKLGVVLTHRQGLQLWGAALGDGMGVRDHFG